MRIAGIDMTPFLQSVAAELAHLGDDEQAAFFNTFAKELNAVCQTRHMAEMQAVGVSRRASNEFKDFCGMVSHDAS